MNWICRVEALYRGRGQSFRSLRKPSESEKREKEWKQKEEEAGEGEGDDRRMGHLLHLPTRQVGNRLLLVEYT